MGQVIGLVGKHAPHVYFMQFGKDTPVKIGWTCNLGARLQTIASSHWTEPTILEVTPGDRSAEAKLHHLLAAHRIRKSEWFRPTPEVMKMVDDARHNELPEEVKKSLDFAGGKSPEDLYRYTKGMVCPTCHRPTYRDATVIAPGGVLKVDDEGYVSIVPGAAD